MSRFAYGLIAALITTTAWAAPQYQVTNLTEAFYTDYGDSTLIESCEITSMNDSGQFFGQLTFTNGKEDIFVWELDSQPVLAGLNTDRVINDSGITNNGKVAGVFQNATTQERQVYIWDTISSSLEYPDVDASLTLRIVDMNEDGSIAGIKMISNDAAVAFGGNIVQETSGYPLTLGIVPESHASAINDSDVVVGHYNVSVGGPSLGPDMSSQAFTWNPEEGITDIGNFIAEDINHSGQVIGWNEEIVAIQPNGLPDWQHYSVFWNGSELHEIGTLGEFLSTILYHLNDSCQAVGCASGNGEISAIYWDLENGLFDINELVPEETPWHLHHADTIVNNGSILARGSIKGEETNLLNDDTFFLLMPTNVPEPGVLVLLLGIFFTFRFFANRKPQ